MTGTTTSLARETLPEGPRGRGETGRFLAFVRHPVLPDRATGFSFAALGAVLRLYLLDLALMAILMAAASLAMGAGFTFPENDINSLKLTPQSVALIVLLAPAMEETVFRSWLSGRPGQFAALALLGVAVAVLAAFSGRGPALSLAIIAVGVGAAIAALWRLRARPPVGWFARGFPLFYGLTTVAFALVHLFNYKEGTLPVLLPLVVPQLIAGAIFGYARVTYGFWSNVLLHMLHNGTAVALVLLATAAGAAA